MESSDKTIYRRGADWGLPLGGVMAGVFFCMVVGLHWAWANALGMLLLVAIPVITYVSLWQTHRDCHGLTAFSALWMQGITMFFCASLLASLLGFVYMRWVDPELLNQVCLSAAETYEKLDSPGAQELAKDLHTIVDRNLMPPPINVVMGWMWLGVFCGSILSMIVSAIVRLRKVSTVRDLRR